MSIGSIGVREVVHHPNLHKDWHRHEIGSFVFTIEGFSREWFADCQYERPARSVLYRPAGARHRDVIGPRGARCLVLELPLKSSEFAQCGPALDQPKIFRLDAVAGLAQHAYAEWLLGDCASNLVIHALTLEIIACLIRYNGTRRATVPPLWLRRVKQRLDEGFSEPLSLTELAGIAGVHSTHLARQFRSHFGQSVGEYLRQRRIDAARDLLVTTRRPLTEIAFDTGFCHQAHFTAVFKRSTGISPSSFRRIFSA